MELGISNIAWNREEDHAILRELPRLGVTALEMAPTKLWDKPVEVDEASLIQYRKSVENEGLRIAAFQSLFFNQPDLKIFGSAEARAKSVDYLRKLCDMASTLGVKALVFGSPACRNLGGLDYQNALDIAITFFHEVGQYAASREVCVCIEPLPKSMGCEFIQNSLQGEEFVRSVNSQGFRLHLDSASMAMNEEDYESTINKSKDLVRHFHISEIGYGVIGSTNVDHKRLAKALRSIVYPGVVSIEMIAKQNHPNIDRVQTAVRYAHSIYMKH